MMNPRKLYLYLIFSIIWEPISSFTSVFNHKKSSLTRCHLVPSQGSQLIAASCAALSEKKRSKEKSHTKDPNISKTDVSITSKSTVTSTITGIDNTAEANSMSVARSFISRLFHTPSTPSTYENALSSLPSTLFENDQTLLYPITGFRWVATDDLDFPQDNKKKKYTAIPTTCTASCNIQSIRQTQIQDAYGWFSPACKEN